jgi:hypothetical protein
LQAVKAMPWRATRDAPIGSAESNREKVRLPARHKWVSFFFWLFAPPVCYHLFSTGFKEDNVAILEGRFASILHHLHEEELSWFLV